MNEFASLSPMSQALTLMLVGMGTVFVVLVLIICLSKGMIAVLNKVAPAEEATRKAVPAAAPAAVAPQVAEAIRQAVRTIAPGAVVTKIVKK